ncbi:TIGR01440 family protein [Bacillus sp. FSL K6-3431]
MEKWREEMQAIVRECSEQLRIKSNGVLVIGCSTSEVAGEKIGTSGTMEVATIIFEELKKYADKEQIHLAFQCCEHLNRALVIERSVADEKDWEEVSVIPSRNAGGAMATYAFSQFLEPVVIEHIQADAGIDIGDTFIGMHIKRVAVPIRINQKVLGNAHITIAMTRPKLIGGARAIYEKEKLNDQCDK